VLRSLYTGISGMRSMQTMMDVTGNNIANVNTTGYKTANTVFEDTLSQTLRNASGSVGANGGTNPAQVGLGVRVSSITTNFTQGATQTTGRNTDMLINGDGFFVVQNQGANMYTRNGAFSLDNKGQLVAANGAKVMGWQADANGAVSTAAAVTPLTIPTGLLSNPKTTSLVTLNGNLNNAATGDADAAADVNEAQDAGSVISMSYPIYDAQGASSPVAMKLTPIAAADGDPKTITSWKVEGSYGSQTFTGTLKIPTTGDRTFEDGAGGLGDNADASVTAPTVEDGGSGNIKITGLTGSDGSPFDLVINTTDVTSTAQSGQTSSVKIDSQNGHAAASLSSWTLGEDGTITGVFSDSTTQTLGKLAVATFNNPAGLSKSGGSLYAGTVNSGTASIGSAGDAGRGTITSGALEMSNVDLAQEFTNLIVSQRGFQANSRVITTSDSMLEELVNLKR
jgi:flagellar hook protein FlgE